MTTDHRELTDAMKAAIRQQVAHYAEIFGRGYVNQTNSIIHDLWDGGVEAFEGTPLPDAEMVATIRRYIYSLKVTIEVRIEDPSAVPSAPETVLPFEDTTL